MTQEENKEKPDVLKELAELYETLRRSDFYSLNNGKWDPAEIIPMLELRKRALEKTLEAVKAGHNRGTIVESMLATFGIDPFYPRF